MSYIGNNPEVNAFTVGVDKFNGTGAALNFTLSRDIHDSKAIEVVVNGVQQEPDEAYTVTNSILTFTEAPSSGANNIIVTYRAPVVVTFNQVSTSQIQAGSVTESKIASGAVTTTKIAASSITGDKLIGNIVRANNIVAGQITGNLIATGAISGNQIGENAITGNLMSSGSISGNNIVDNAIRANNIVAGQITGNLIAPGVISGNLLGIGAVSGNNLGIGSISANNFAGGGITSNVLASNLNISVSRTLETATVNSTAIGGTGNVNIDVVNNSVYLFTSAATANMQFNIRANSTHSFDAVTNVGQTTSVAIAVRGQTNRYTANLMIDGVRQTLNFSANARPQFLAISVPEYNIFTYTVIKTGSAAYTVFTSNSLFGTA